MKPPPSELYSILIVQITVDRWSYSIVKGTQRVYNSSASWVTPQECWDDAIREYSRLKLN